MLAACGASPKRMLDTNTSFHLVLFERTPCTILHPWLVYPAWMPEPRADARGGRSELDPVLGALRAEGWMRACAPDVLSLCCVCRWLCGLWLICQRGVTLLPVDSSFPPPRVLCHSLTQLQIIGKHSRDERVELLVRKEHFNGAWNRTMQSHNRRNLAPGLFQHMRKKKKHLILALNY